MASYDNVMPVDGGEPWAFYEYHHYDGGLRVTPLSLTGPRPSWAPPAEWAGYRNEVPLSARDILVDFTRINHAGRRISWLGLYTFGLDSTYGDRENYKGLGIWICEREICNPELVLRELRNIFFKLGPDTLTEVSSHLLQYINTPELLPKRLLPSEMIPGELSGSKRGTDPLPVASVMVARENAGTDRWPSVSEQLLRISYLRDQNSDVSRQLILLLDPQKSGRSIEGVEEMRDGLAAELVQQIPIIFGDVIASKNQMDQVLRQRDYEILALHKDIGILREEYEDLRILNLQLNDTVSNSDIATIANRINSLEQLVINGNRSIRELIERGFQPEKANKQFGHPANSKIMAPPQTRNLPPPNHSKGFDDWVVIAIYVAIALVLVTIGFGLDRYGPFKAQPETQAAASDSDRVLNTTSGQSSSADPISSSDDARPIRLNNEPQR
jgi:hypothetical protein